MTNSLLLAISVGMLLLPLSCQAFLVPTTSSTKSRRGGVKGSKPARAPFSALHVQKKRRRRRRDVSEEGDADGVTGEYSSGGLPEFELDDDEEEAEAVAKSKRAAVSRNPDEITSAMMGSPNSPSSSIRDLLTDRSLESKLQFDEEDITDNSLPDLVVLSRSATQEGASTGSKKARKAAAIAANESKADSIVSKLPFVTNEKGEFSTVKVSPLSGTT